MTVTRTLALAAATGAGLLALAQPASAAGGDYQVWRRTYVASPSDTTTVAGDFDHDGDVDGRDFLVWQR